MKEWGEGLFKALRAKSVRKEENPVVKGKMNGGTSTTAEAIMDSRWTHLITTKIVIDAMKVEETPLAKELTIKEALGKNLPILGTVKMYLETELLWDLIT